MYDATETKKWSDIQGLAAVTIDSGSKVGTVDNFYFDPSNGAIPAFVIKTGTLSHGVLPTTEISAIGLDALTYRHEQPVTKKQQEEALSRTLYGRDLLDYRVMSENGDVIGKIGNLILDVSQPSAIRLVAIELSGGLREHLKGTYPTIAFNQILSFGQDVVVIPKTVALTLFHP